MCPAEALTVSIGGPDFIVNLLTSGTATYHTVPPKLHRHTKFTTCQAGAGSL